ncbi:endonuclease/exonuclease/phosphatase family protein [Nitratifractor sp.]
MIFLPKRRNFRCRGEKCLSALPGRFSLLCWNLHKRNPGEEAFLSYLQTLARRYDLQLLLFQEMPLDPEPFQWDGFSWEAAANLRVGGRHFGVLSACRTPALTSESRLSDHAEGFCGPKKSLLLTRYPLEGGEVLTVLNLHAINFRENGAYARELEWLVEHLKDCTGPLIVAGDFNSWSGTRERLLGEFAGRLSLRRVEFGKGEVASFLGHPLDAIFYRGLSCLGGTVLRKHGLSDHHPLIAEFEVDDG